MGWLTGLVVFALVWVALARIHRGERASEELAELKAGELHPLGTGYTGRCMACGQLSDDCIRFSDGADICATCMERHGD